MWRRVLSNLATGIGGGNGGACGGGEAGGAMMTTWVRNMSKKRAENLRKINPKVPYPVATSIAQDLFQLIHNRGPLTYGIAWTSTQEAGIGGLNSKSHMKLLLKWMRGKKMLKQICQPAGTGKKFLLCTPDAAQAELANRPEVKPQSKKPSQKRKKHKK